MSIKHDWYWHIRKVRPGTWDFWWDLRPCTQDPFHMLELGPGTQDSKGEIWETRAGILTLELRPIPGPWNKARDPQLFSKVGPKTQNYYLNLPETIIFLLHDVSQQKDLLFVSKDFSLTFFIFLGPLYQVWASCEIKFICRFALRTQTYNIHKIFETNSSFFQEIFFIYPRRLQPPWYIFIS